MTSCTVICGASHRVGVDGGHPQLLPQQTAHANLDSVPSCMCAVHAWAEQAGPHHHMSGICWARQVCCSDPAVPQPLSQPDAAGAAHLARSRALLQPCPCSTGPAQACIHEHWQFLDQTQPPAHAGVHRPQRLRALRGFHGGRQVPRHGGWRERRQPARLEPQNRGLHLHYPGPWLPRTRCCLYITPGRGLPRSGATQQGAGTRVSRRLWCRGLQPCLPCGCCCMGESERQRLWLKAGLLPAPAWQLEARAQLRRRWSDRAFPVRCQPQTVDWAPHKCSTATCRLG